MNRFTFFIFMLIFCTMMFNQIIAQTNWTKDPGNPILIRGSIGSWDDGHLWYPYVIFDNSIYHMWYSGNDNDNSDNGNWRIGYATSEDGIQWTKYSENPVLDLGPAGSWDDRHIFSGPVLVMGDTLKMWYVGYDGTILRAGLAISTNGINWTKYNDPATSTAPYTDSDPVLQPGAAGSWDDTNAYLNSVMYDGGIYKGWYYGTDGPDLYSGRIGYATSEDGIHWTKYDDPGTTDPPYAESDYVLDFGLTGSWDDSDISNTQVILEGETYHMFYNGGHGDIWRSGYAKSEDEVHWKKYDSNPVLDIGTSGTWDDVEANVTSVILQDSIFQMWYWGFSGSRATIGYATAPLEIPTGIYDELSSELPKKFVLMQNYPNPFNPATTISYQLPVSSEVELIVFSVTGQKVTTLISERQSAGNHKYVWDASALASGVYFYRITAGEFVQAQKLLLLKQCFITC